MEQDNYHGTLIRQLKRSQLRENVLPQDIESWKNFLSSVNRAYNEFDQDRYTLERSQEVVSREMQTLVDSLNQSQMIAHLGSWQRDIRTNKGIWSTEMYKLFNRDPSLGAPDFDEVFTLIHPDDQEKLKLIVNNAVKSGETFSMEIRIPNNDKMRWVEVMGIPHCENSDGPVIAIHGTCLDITTRKEAEVYTESLHQQLLQTARKAGMADVATSVLHNIGNVLNSVNVLVTVLTEILEKSELRNFEKTVQIMNNNKSALGPFFANHPQGQYLLEFLNILSEAWVKDKKYMLSELSKLNEHIGHIKNIISAQQSISGSKGMVEAINLSTLLEDSLMMAMASEVNKHEIEIIRRYDYNDSFLVDKNKLSQILINLIRNARDAVNEHPADGKKIFIHSFCKDSYVSIEICDSGIGVEENKRTQIFSHGFTTKKEGHGFGLHASALASKEMGGDLQVKSEGIGKGATFIVKLPIINKLRSASGVITLSNK
ncbi:MAG TPA: ATP-binding protein [Gammaproteobacteria bacterium]|nr:ATP-binding protein [Gammaproteobacteria bacterium]